MPTLIRSLTFLMVCAGCGTPSPAPAPRAHLGSRPPIPDQPNYPDDSLYVVIDPDNSAATYYRRLAWIAFESSATDAEVGGFFTRFAAEIVGGVPATGTYYIQFPDPVPSWTQVDSVLQLMDEAPGIRVAAEIARVLPKAELDAGSVSPHPASPAP